MTREGIRRCGDLNGTHFCGRLAGWHRVHGCDCGELWLADGALLANWAERARTAIAVETARLEDYVLFSANRSPIEFTFTLEDVDPGLLRLLRGDDAHMAAWSEAARSAIAEQRWRG